MEANFIQAMDNEGFDSVTGSTYFIQEALWCFVQFCFMSSIAIISTVIAILLSLKLLFKFTKTKNNGGSRSIAFYHPYCNSRGGGERVLWTAIRALQLRYNTFEYYIYTGDFGTTESILEKVEECFGIKLNSKPKLVYLRGRPLLEAKYYPVFTLLLQSLGSVLLGFECLLKLRPDILIDTTGHAFIYPIFSYLGDCSVVSYTHYPTISTDMLTRVSDRYEAHNNRPVIARSEFLSNIKNIYYRMFAYLYGHVGRYADVIMVNSSWTRDHINQIWNCRDKLTVVYPPCDTVAFDNLKLMADSDKLTKSIVSIGQFRPEKNYPLQLRAFSRLVTSEESANLELVLIGGVRNFEDEERVSSLKIMAEELGISDKVRWRINASFADLLTEVQQGSIGLHTMWNEHFGISVVECMAGGLIMLAHDSGGPKADIVVKWDGVQTGFLADSEESYYEKMKHILKLNSDELKTIRNAARASIKRFTEDKFENTFINTLGYLL